MNTNPLLVRRRDERGDESHKNGGPPSSRVADPGAARMLPLLLCLTLTACTTGKVLVTPLVVVRDTVDLPTVTVTNVFSWTANSSGGPSAFVGPSWSLRRGFDFGASLNLAGLIFWTLSGGVGSVDYVVCRSFYPNFPGGLSPWREHGESWWGLYYPCTRALWSSKPESPPPAPPGHEEPEKHDRARPVPPGHY